MRSAKHAPSTENDSNRGHGKSLIYLNKSLAYVGSIVKRWDTSEKMFEIGLFDCSEIYEKTLKNL
jgi:hypothetical protein